LGFAFSLPDGQAFAIRYSRKIELRLKSAERPILWRDESDWLKRRKGLSIYLLTATRRA
jgi:hypothetical protein